MTGNSMSQDPSGWPAPVPQDSLRGPSPVSLNVLPKGEPVTLNIDQALPTLNLADITGHPDTPGFKSEIVGLINLHGAEKDAPNPIRHSMAVIKSTSPYGADSVLLMGLEQDEQGRKRTTSATSLDLPIGLELTIGRGTSDSAGDLKHIDGKSLFGKEFGKDISRDHLKIRWEGGGKELVIEDVSTNGVSVEGSIGAAPESEKPQIEPKIAKGLGSTGVRGIISEVPKTPEDLARLREEAIAGPMAEIDAQMEEVRAQMAALKEGLSESDQMSLWKYAAGRLNEQEMRAAGRTQDARNDAMLSSEGWNSMTAEARKRSADYYQLMRQNSLLIKRSSELRAGF